MPSAYQELRQDVYNFACKLVDGKFREHSTAFDRFNEAAVGTSLLKMLVQKYPEVYSDGSCSDKEGAKSLPWYDCVTSDQAISRYSENGWPWAAEATVPRKGDTPGHLVNRLYVAAQMLEQNKEVRDSHAAQMYLVNQHVQQLEHANEELRIRAELAETRVRNRDAEIKQYERMPIVQNLAVLECENNKLRYKLGLQTLPYRKMEVNEHASPTSLLVKKQQP